MSKDKSNKSKTEISAPHLPKKVVLTGQQRADNARYRQAQRAAKSVFGRWKRTARDYGNGITKTAFRKLVLDGRTISKTSVETDSGPKIVRELDYTISQSQAVFG